MEDTIITRPSLFEMLNHLEKEYTKPDSKLETKESGRKGLKVATLSNGQKYSVRTSRKRYFFPHEWYGFWNALETDGQRLTADMLINTGARINEAYNVLVGDIDWEKKTMTLRITKIKASKGEDKSEPRTIKLSSAFIERLKIYCKGKNPTDKIGMMSKPYTRQMIKRFCKKSGIKDEFNFSPHNFRKTAGNFLKALNVNPLEICSRLGHDQNTFLKAYGSSDVFSKEERLEIRKIVGDIYE